ncbi:VWA domain-containing protein [Streptomyces bauhiniae]|uniref:VWA domain-containing protein n=1 Tax=Streptomyces bauhiniae TaxID=2340725 RepID=UPI0036600D60
MELPEADGASTREPAADAGAGVESLETESAAAPATPAEAETAAPVESPEADGAATREPAADGGAAVESPKAGTAPVSEALAPERSAEETPAPVEAASAPEAPGSAKSAEAEVAAVPETPATAEVPAAESPKTDAPVTEEPVTPADAAAQAETADAPEEKATEPDPLATAAPEIEPLLMEPAILDADPEIVVPQQRTEPLLEAEAEHDQPAIPEQSTEPAPTPEADQDSTSSPAPKAQTEAEPKANPAPEADVDATTTPEPEPEAGAKPTTAPEPEALAPAEPDARADSEPAPEATPAPEAKAETEAEAKPEAAAEPEAKADSEPTSALEVDDKASTTFAPEAADAPAPPQAAPAGDNASRTGGAGGNTTEAEPLRGTPSLTTAHTAAAATLAHTGLTDTAAKLYLVLDRSSSMRPYYRDGSAQALADQTLALAAHLDKDPTVHVVFFSTEVDGTTDLTLTEDHVTKIDATHARLGRMGRTNYHAAVAAVLAHHDQHNAPEDNVLVVFQIDGAPDAKTPATLALANAAQTHPKVFFSFVGFGEQDNKAFDYLRRLKTGNTSFFHAGPTPRELTDTELYEGVLATWRP